MRNFARLNIRNIYNLLQIMKKILLLLTLATILVNTAMAVPAKPGLWQMLRLTDGTEVRALLCGDEHSHYWITEDGQRLIESGDAYTTISSEQLAAQKLARRAPSNSTSLKSPKKVKAGERTHYVGQKKGLVILAQFTDKKFLDADSLALYKRILNEKGLLLNKFKGSVSDYFYDQSNGQFELTFDVLGPIELQYEVKYYGGNDRSGNDMRPIDMIIEACKAVDAEVDFNDYDWDNDGEVDEVFVVYAGKGEANSGDRNTIWPHMNTLTNGEKSLTLDGVKIDTYACSSELNGNGSIEGIGTFCHEFSHCLGFPDFYDITYSGWFGMADFDLMCAGSYNGGGFTPPNYSTHELLMCGWLEPTVLGEEDVTIDSLQPRSNNGETFIIYNTAYPDEYYTIENRQLSGWDAAFPGRGLMVLHVDFDPNIWRENTPNTPLSVRDAIYYGMTPNDHQRMTILHADNNNDSAYWNPQYKMYTRVTTSTDLYPYYKRDSINALSTPALEYYNDNGLGELMARWSITDIKQNADGTMSFKYHAPVYTEEEKKILGITSHTTAATNTAKGIYSLSGCYLGTSLHGLPRGMYIVNGRKVIKN